MPPRHLRGSGSTGTVARSDDRERATAAAPALSMGDTARKTALPDPAFTLQVQRVLPLAGGQGATGGILLFSDFESVCTIDDYAVRSVLLEVLLTRRREYFRSGTRDRELQSRAFRQQGARGGAARAKRAEAAGR